MAWAANLRDALRRGLTGGPPSPALVIPSEVTPAPAPIAQPIYPMPHPWLSPPYNSAPVAAGVTQSPTPIAQPIYPSPSPNSMFVVTRGSGLG